MLTTDIQQTPKRKTALVVGATGLVGKELVHQLCAHPHYERVIALVRRPLDIKYPNLEQRLFNFDAPDMQLVEGDDFYCALGTTLKKAGSLAAQRRIDVEYPLEMGKLARQKGVKRYLLVSAIGANAQSGNAYLKMKGDLEEGLAALEFPLLVAARPSFLLGERAEFRLGERIGIGIAQAVGPLMRGPLLKYKGIEGAQVAKALIGAANSGWTGVHILEGDDLFRW